MSQDYTHIRVALTTKSKLEAVKLNRSFDEYLNIMLHYFAITGIAPETYKEHPTAQLEKRIEYVVTLIKGIEKSRLIPIHDSIKMLKSSINTDADINENYISLGEATELFEKVKEQEKDITDLEGEVKRLKALLGSKENKTEPTTQLNKQAINETIRIILDSVKPEKFNIGHVSILKTDLEAYLGRIQDEIK